MKSEMANAIEEKLDAHGRRLLASGQLRGPLDIVLRTQSPITSEQESKIRNAGCVLRSKLGNVLSGVVDDATRLAEIAQLPFVQQIELSRPMFQEGQGH